MEVIKGLENVKCEPQSSVTVGSFDGLHLGHQRIIQQMLKIDEPITVITFYPHPQSVVRPNQSQPPLLTSFSERLVLFKKIGVNRLIIVEFDKAFASMSPEEFVEDLLLKTVGMSNIFVGPRHGFGQGRKGDVELLTKLGQEHNYGVHVIDPVNRFGERISSTRIRKLLQDGDALTAWRCLGRPYYLDGKVVVGERRGIKLGFPTANLAPTDPEKLVPPSGIYATVSEIDGIRWPSVSHFGSRPTFKGAGPALETHIIGFKGNIYNKEIRVGLIDKLRDIITFKTPTDLVRQLAMDVREAVQRLAELGFGANARLRIQRYGKVLL